MTWWIVVLLPVPVFAVLALLAVIATAFSISAEEDRRRVRLKRLAHQPPDAAPEHEARTALELLRERREHAADPGARVNILHH